jgi:hypothetical protein
MLRIFNKRLAPVTSNNNPLGIFNRYRLVTSMIPPKTYTTIFYIVYINYIKLTTIPLCGIFFANMFYGCNYYAKAKKINTMRDINTKDFSNYLLIFCASYFKFRIYLFSSVFVVPFFVVMYDIYYNNKRRDHHLIAGKKYFNFIYQ